MTETILIVDDSTFIVEGLVALLKKRYRPIPCFSGEECLSILRTTTPSLIILDIMMEPMDGWETLARIKADERSRHIPVLMFSAKKISPEEAEAHRIIIDDFITKPVNPQKLLEAIGKVLVRQSFNRQVLTQWTAAGVSPALIDRYLTLKMNLDVDVSLLAVMHRQLDIAYAGAANREEIARSIATIEERIAATRALIESFCREQAGTLPPVNPEEVPQEGSTSPAPSPPADAGTPPVAAALPAAEHMPSAAPENAREQTEEVLLPPPRTPDPERENPVQAGPAIRPGPVPELPVEPAPDVLPRPDPEEPVPDVPVLTPPATPRPALVVPVFAGPAPAPVAVGPEIALPVPDNGPGPVQVTPPLPASREIPEDLFEPFDVPDRSPPQPPVAQQPKEAEALAGHTLLPPMAPARRSHVQQPGGGTVTPPMRTLAGTSRSSPAKSDEPDPAAAIDSPPPTGAIARLISAILALFRRPKR